MFAAVLTDFPQLAHVRINSPALSAIDVHAVVLSTVSTDTGSAPETCSATPRPNAVEVGLVGMRIRSDQTGADFHVHTALHTVMRRAISQLEME